METKDVLGYRVEKVERGDGKRNYFFTGKRGAVYILMQTANDQNLFFVMNSMGNVC